MELEQVSLEEWGLDIKIQRQEKRKLAELAAREKEMQDAKDVEQLKEFQKLASGGRPEITQTGV